jgi:hypothetical protein
MKRPNESDYTSHVAYARALEEYCDVVAQPAQEPVAWMRPSEEGYDSAFRDHSTVVACTGNPWTGWIPLYTAPPAAQPAPVQFMASDELMPRTPAEKKAYLEGVRDGKMYAVRDGLASAPPAAQPEQETHNFCPRCGKRLQGVLGQPQVHTCTPPLWGHK